MNVQSAGKMLVLFGGIMAVTGLVLMFFEKIPFLGKLPGDITIKRDNVEILFPLTTSIVLSALISLAFWAISQWRGK